jgi:hypothetical protein
MTDPRQPDPAIYHKKLVRSAGLLIRFLRAVERGEYELTSAERIWLRALRDAIRDSKPPAAR